LKMIAAIEDPPVIVRILPHLGLPTRARRVRRIVESSSSKQSEELPTQANGRSPELSANGAISNRSRPSVRSPDEPTGTRVGHQAPNGN
jgi:hypothetical protein